MNYFYKKHGVILARSPQWQIDLYGFAPDGIGDCIFRTAIMAIAKYDHDMLHTCVTLLDDPIRWPYLLDPPKVKGKKPYRSQKYMTRDPYIMTFCAMYLLTEGPTCHLKALSMPWYTHRPYLKSWIKYLVATGDRNSSTDKVDKLKCRYERLMLRLIRWGDKTKDIRLFVEKYKLLRWTRHQFGIHGYSLHLWAWMAYTAASSRVKDKLIYHIPHWNFLLLALIVGPPTHEPFIRNVRNYISKRVYQWTREQWIDGAYLPAGEKYYLDKDILNWVLNRES